MNQRTPQTAGQAEDAAVQLEHDFVGIIRDEIGMHEPLATVFSRALVRGLRRVLGGQDLYIPTPDKSERDASIRRDYNGDNMEELMRAHGIGRTRFYEIIGARPQRPRRGDQRDAKNPESSLESGRTDGYGGGL
ncbi:Mor transcription activator family protein [Variovorax sp. AB1(2024)]|uniref:Mor transcription activator family protein n=1 Tax=Variovorax sp. AB1(2024) TaxID=3132214 RepID=UPI00309CBA83